MSKHRSAMLHKQQQYIIAGINKSNQVDNVKKLARLSSPYKHIFLRKQIDEN